VKFTIFGNMKSTRNMTASIFHITIFKTDL